MLLRHKTNAEFVAYLEGVMFDLEDSGLEAAAADYAEMVRRMDEVAYTVGRAIDLMKELEV